MIFPGAFQLCRVSGLANGWRKRIEIFAGGNAMKGTLPLTIVPQRVVRVPHKTQIRVT